MFTIKLGEKRSSSYSEAEKAEACSYIELKHQQYALTV